MRTIRRFLLPIIVVAVLLGAVIIAAIPPAVPVDTELAEQTDLLITIDEDGRTRVTDRYVVFAPLAGRMERIALKAGDPIDDLRRACDAAGRDFGEMTVLLFGAPLDAAVIAEFTARGCDGFVFLVPPERLGELPTALDEIAALRARC